MSTEPTKRPLRTPADDEIPSLLEALAAAGGNTAAFAREHGLSPWKLHEAQRGASGGGSRRRERRRKADRIFARVRVVEERAAPAEPLELVLVSGHRLRIPAGFDETTLRRVMGVTTHSAALVASTLVALVTVTQNPPGSADRCPRRSGHGH